MKEFGSILVLITLLLTRSFFNTSSRLSTEFSDSSKVSSAPVIQTHGLSGGVVQNLDINNQVRKSNFDCKAFPPDSTFPKMKILVPDTSLTASMPVLKPGHVDPDIFIPGFGCADPEYQD